jgi:hypothetical protein
MTEAKYPAMELIPAIEPLQKPSFKEKLASYKQYLTSKEGWIGEYVGSSATMSADMHLGLHVFAHSESAVYEKGGQASTVLCIAFQVAYFSRFYSRVYSYL